LSAAVRVPAATRYVAIHVKSNYGKYYTTIRDIKFKTSKGYPLLPPPYFPFTCKTTKLKSCLVAMAHGTAKLNDKTQVIKGKFLNKGVYNTLAHWQKGKIPITDAAWKNCDPK
jgi:hypothetical protein